MVKLVVQLSSKWNLNRHDGALVLNLKLLFPQQLKNLTPTTLKEQIL